MMEWPPKYFNRYTQQVETEAVYGSGGLRWLYGNPNSLKFLIIKLVSLGSCAKFYGWLMRLKGSKKRIAPFIETYKVDASEFLKEPDSFASFDDFFSRKLKPSARPINPDSQIAVFPADGRHLGFEDISTIESIFVKGQRFNLAKFLGSEEAAAPYKHGSLVLSRLCPTDYHRFHFPVSGACSNPKLIQGKLRSVNPIALAKQIAIFWENKRFISSITSERFGRVIMAEVGATFVGSVNSTFSHNQTPQKGDEKGFFSFGGSSIVLIFEPGKIKLAGDLLEHSRQMRELYAKMGDTLGEATQ